MAQTQHSSMDARRAAVNVPTRASGLRKLHLLSIATLTFFSPWVPPSPAVAQTPEVVGEVAKGVKFGLNVAEAVDTLGDFADALRYAHDVFAASKKGEEPKPLDPQVTGTGNAHDRLTKLRDALKTWQVPQDPAMPAFPTLDALTSMDGAQRRQALHNAVERQIQLITELEQLAATTRSMGDIARKASQSLNSCRVAERVLGEHVKTGPAGLFDPVTKALGSPFVDVAIVFPPLLAEIRDLASTKAKACQQALQTRLTAQLNLASNLRLLLQAEAERFGVDPENLKRRITEWNQDQQRLKEMIDAHNAKTANGRSLQDRIKGIPDQANRLVEEINRDVDRVNKDSRLQRLARNKAERQAIVDQEIRPLEKDIAETERGLPSNPANDGVGSAFARAGLQISRDRLAKWKARVRTLDQNIEPDQKWLDGEKRSIEAKKSRHEKLVQEYRGGAAQLEQLAKGLDTSSRAIKELEQSLEERKITLERLIAETMRFGEHKQDMATIEQLVRELSNATSNGERP